MSALWNTKASGQLAPLTSSLSPRHNIVYIINKHNTAFQIVSQEAENLLRYFFSANPPCFKELILEAHKLKKNGELKIVFYFFKL